MKNAKAVKEQPREVTTLQGVRYRLDRKLGEGGQGAVFATNDKKYVVKRLRVRGDAAREKLRDQLAMVKRLPLDGLPVARPLDQLRPPHVGYVMEFASGMSAIEQLVHPPNVCKPLVEWYIQTGGLRRRLMLLAKAAEIIARLHGKGLIYSDPSPGNIFISNDPGETEVWLIDADNLRASSVVEGSVYTPKYGAPELVKGKASASSLTDAHAFAVIAFQVLSLAHPLLGDMVNEGDPELEERALAGELPWIHDVNDDRNRCSSGLPRTITLSKQLSKDFSDTFGAGLNDPQNRPGLARWVEHLYRAADNTLLCSKCGFSYYRAEKECPVCDAPKPSHLVVRCQLWDPERIKNTDVSGTRIEKPGSVTSANGQPRIIDSMVIGVGEGVDISSRLACGDSKNSQELWLEVSQSDVTIEALSDKPWRLRSMDGKAERELSEGPLRIPLEQLSGWYLMAGNSGKLHRQLKLSFKNGVKA